MPAHRMLVEPCMAPDAGCTRILRPLVIALRRFQYQASGLPHEQRTGVFANAVAGASGLVDILENDFRLQPEAVHIAGRIPVERTLRAWRKKCDAAKAKARSLEKQLSEFKANETHRLTLHWAVAAGLSDPSASNRSVESWCREFAVSKSKQPISKSSVSAMRDTFAQILYDMNKADAKRYVETAGNGFIVVRHLHDEATMRLRSTMAAPAAPAAPEAPAPVSLKGVPRRGRSSKIQNAVVTLHRSASAGDGLQMHLELQPLDRKDAATIATSLHSVAASLIEACSRSRPTRVIHCVVGDGVFSNGVAVRLLWQWMERDGAPAAAPAAGRATVTYRLLAFTCSTHAANLVVRGAICGDERNVTGEGGRPDGHPLVAACVRYLKYLLPEYAVEFSIKLRSWVSEQLVVLPGAPDPQDTQRLRGLQELYGTRVLPEALLELLNGAPGSLQHFEDGHGRYSGSPVGRESLVTAVSIAIERLCFRAEERPVTTRFWLFASCVDSLFTFVLLQVPPAKVLQTGIKNPRTTFQKRIAKVCRYLEDPKSRLQLATACLCLRITSVATSITGQKYFASGASSEGDGRSSGSQGDGRSSGSRGHPLLVKLARGDLASRTDCELRCILQNLHKDAELGPHLALVILRLLVTQGQVVLRFSQYRSFPGRIVLLSKHFNPDGCYYEALHILQCDVSELDRGFSLPLRQEAWDSGPTITQALEHLMSQKVQDEIDSIAMAIETSTLDVERKHNLDKRVERRVVSSVAKASRDSVVRAWRSTSGAKGSAAPAARIRAKLAKRKRSLSHLGTAAFACQKHPEFFPSQRNASCRKELRERGASLRAYVAEHKESLQAELVELRAQAAAALTDHDAMLPSFELSWPKDKEAWYRWLLENQTRFENLLREARGGVRRAVSQRLKPAPEVPDSAPSLLQKRKVPKVPWARLVRNGWYALRLQGRPALPAASAAAPAAAMQRFVVLVVSAGHTKAAFAPREVMNRGFQVPCSIDLSTALKPLWEAVPACYLQKAVEVFELQMQCVFSENTYWLHPIQATRAVAPKPKRKSRPSGSGDVSDRSSDSETNSDDSRDSKLPATDTDDQFSLASTADSSVEMHSDSDNEAAPAAVEDAPGARALAHTHTAWSNDYFVLTDNRNFDNVRMRIQHRWTGANHLGTSLVSKTLVPAHFGDSREQPDQIVLVLKAWMLHRWAADDRRFLLQRRSRLQAWIREESALRAAIQERGGPDALHPHARATILHWAPTVLDPAAPAAAALGPDAAA